MFEITKVLHQSGKLSAEQYDQVSTWLKNNTSIIEPEVLNELDLTTGKRLSYIDRLTKVTHPLTRKLLQVVIEKESNLCVSADLNKIQDILKLADQVGPHVCMLKLHVDIIDDFSQKFLEDLQELAVKHNFLIFEDR